MDDLYSVVVLLCQSPKLYLSALLGLNAYNGYLRLHFKALGCPFTMVGAPIKNVLGHKAELAKLQKRKAEIWSA